MQLNGTFCIENVKISLDPSSVRELGEGVL